MTKQKLLNFLRQPAVACVIAITLIVAGLTAIPSVRSSIAANLNSSSNLFLFDGEVDENGDNPGESGNPDANSPGGDKKPNKLKRIVSAPVRLVARLFRKDGGNDDKMAIKKATERDMQNLKVIPVNRTQDGTPGQIADTNGTAAEASTAEAAAQNLFGDAVDLHDKGRSSAAIEKLVAATVLKPNYAEAYNLLAVCYDEKGQYASAQNEYKKALKIESNNARFLNNIGYSYYLSGNYGDAVKWYNKGLKVTPNDRRMHNNIGLAYGRKGDYDKAKEHFVIAVGETGANLNLGYVYSQQGKYDEAIKYYEAALRSQPQSLPALGNLSQLYERTGRIREAAVLGDQYKKLTISAQQKDQAADQK